MWSPVLFTFESFLKAHILFLLNSCWLAICKQNLASHAAVGSLEATLTA